MERRHIDLAKRKDAAIDLPPSKSYTARALVAAALADGVSVIPNPSRSTDSETMVSGLRAFGVRIDDLGDRLRVTGTGGAFPRADRTIDVGNAGTCMRFLTAVAALAPGTTVLTGSPAMLRRPAGPLVEALRSARVEASCAEGRPPVVIRGGTFKGGELTLDASASSQFLSAILLVAPYARSAVSVSAPGVSSATYIGMTLETMRRFGVVAEAAGSTWTVGSPAAYRATEFPIEPDASSAAFFGAAAAILGGRVTLRGLAPASLQGDVRFFDLLASMGCGVEPSPEGIEVTGGPLRGIDADLNAIPDSVPALAVTAAFASSPTVITGVGHLRHKESDRIEALTTELRKVGSTVLVSGDDLTVVPGPLRGTLIDPRDDHRIAMSFAVAGLAAGGMSIADPECVAKSFPGFWTEFNKFIS